MLNVSNEEIIRLREMWKSISEVYDEKSKRFFVAAMAKAFGHGGLKLSHKITGMNIMSIKMGIDQLNGKVEIEEDRQRKAGGGRKKISDIYPEIKDELDKLIEPATKGDPESPLRWTSKSTYKLAEELTAKGFAISSSTVEDLLKEMGYSLQSNKKTIEGTVRVLAQSYNDQEVIKACDKVIVICEEIVPDEYLRREPTQNLANGYEIDYIVVCPWAAHPTGSQYYYDTDADFLRDFNASTKTQDGFDKFAEEYIYGQ